MKTTDIQKAVCEEFNISLSAMLSQTRKREVAWPRHVAMGLTKEMIVGISLIRIAKAFKRVNHTTIMHGIENYKKLLEAKDWAVKIYNVEKRLKNV